MRPTPRLAALLATVAVLGPVAASTGCGGPDGDARRGPARSILLVTLDTTRADRLGHLGDPEARTPVLDAWARRGASFRDAFADVPLTLPSHATIFTGRPAPAHGVRTNVDFRLGEGAVTLAERMRDAGWATAAVVSSPVLARTSGIAQGFASYDDRLEAPYAIQDSTLFPPDPHWLPKVDRRATETIDRALAGLTLLRAAGDPFLLWVHVYDPHFPWDPVPPWGRLPVDRYRAEIAALDRQLGRLARELAAGAADGGPPIAIVVVGDHGEGLADHGEDEHGILVYDEAMRVPLILSGDGVPRAAAPVPGVARTADVAATVLALAAVPSVRMGRGASLLGAAAETAAPPAAVAWGESMKSRLAYGGSGVRFLRTADWKLILAPRPELYDLRTDPGERTDLAAREPARAQAMTDALEDSVRAALSAGDRTAEASGADPVVRDRLASLGYVAGGTDPAHALGSDVASELALDGFDPKDLVLVAMAGRDLENGFRARASAKLARFRATVDPPSVRPEVAPLWSLAAHNEGTLAMGRGRFDEAAARYREALALADGASPDAAWNLVFALNLGGLPAEALREADGLLGGPNDSERLRLHRALALLLVARRDAARAAFRALAESATTPGLAELAADYAAAVGTPAEAAWRDLYLGSEGRSPEGPLDPLHGDDAGPASR